MQEYEINIKSDPNNLITVEEFVNYVGIEASLSEEKLSSLLLCVSEAVTNAIVHANHQDPEKDVDIIAEVDEEFLTFRVKDRGTGFNPEEVPDPTAPENLLKDHGRGLFLMRTYLHELRYNITPEGTETVLVMKRNAK
ncbi:MAG: ATP-binding protein [Ignavibacteriales bacterium]|nr:ATP-binding protein [Ignavibacteriaceae bacterium]NLH61735.1 ATP-binding protein [Ignavibacteriales bacterium]HOJ19315.1 ATP-binding protein [Ignavibacteriaceae bacterium]HPO55414.1 ATP-binding protein [Ignavibacteriaceae bacterium]